jgi:hypothetical protein
MRTGESGRGPIPRVELNIPGWVHPVVLILALPASTAAAAILLPQSVYRIWRVHKFLDVSESTFLLLGIASLLCGAVIACAVVAGRRQPLIVLDHRQLRTCQILYSVFLALSIIGYVFWAGAAMRSGVGLRALLAVVDQEAGAISALKRQARPIGGLTTLTQFGPLTVALGVLLRKTVKTRPWYLVVIALSLFRAVFYAERLALIEVLTPMVLVHVLIARPRIGWRSLATKLMPVYAVPGLWALFAAFEYFRSWVFAKRHFTESFAEYITLRLAGYYTTSYNNSALYDQQLARIPGAGYPRLTFPFVENFPVLSDAVPSAQYAGVDAVEWERSVLSNFADPQFTNMGSFLLTHAELGAPGMVVFWLVGGLLIGAAYVALRRGSAVGLIAYSVLVIGVLESPRFLYWTEGRAFPVLVGLAVLGVAMKRSQGATAGSDFGSAEFDSKLVGR